MADTATPTGLARHAADTALAGGVPCVVYAAKSTEDRRGSIPDQLRECRGQIWRDPERVVVGEYVDESFSAFTGDRGPGLSEAMRHAEEIAAEHGVAELWAQHSDRLARGDGRTARHAVEIALWAMKRGIAVRTIQDPDTFRDLLYAVVVGQRNHEDSRRRSLSITAGRRRAAERGEHLGYRPDGYRFIAEVDRNGSIVKRVVIDPDREPVIREIFALALAGMQPGPITNEINRRGLLTRWVRGKAPCAWQVQQICTLLRNPRYAGLSPFHGVVVARGQWPGYISEDQHRWIIGRIGQFKVTKHRRVREPYLLAKLARCGRCGSPLYAMTGHEREDGSFYRSYACASHVRSYDTARCAAAPIPASLLEAMFVSVLARLLIEGEEALVVEPSSFAGWTRSFERERVIDAVSGGDDREINGALERLFASMAPEAALVRELAVSQRAARRVEALGRFRAWCEIERDGRTAESRTETLRLNRLLRSWFDQVVISASERAVTIRAKRSGTQPVEAEVRIAVRDWSRSAAEERRVHPANRRWSAEEILGSLQAWRKRHGRSPRFSDWRMAGPYHPSSLTVRKRFGTWPAALELAGIEPTFPQPVPRNWQWQREEMLQALRDWAEDHGRAPTLRQWRKATLYRPCGETIRSTFGSMAAAIEAAGIR